MSFYSQAGQDKFIANMLDFKRDGYFLEIGSNHPININNTYKLENELNWKGIMVEYEPQFLPMYKEYRNNSIHIINDATKVDYKKVLEENSFPNNLDYLQIDLDVHNGSTLQALENIDYNVFKSYKFATVTFEHDIYRTNYLETRKKSREIFDKNGYIRIFPDIQNIEPEYVFEDWYVHPDLISIEKINNIIELNRDSYKYNSNIESSSISWDKIKYN
jgi:hypothetical protein